MVKKEIVIVAAVIFLCFLPMSLVYAIEAFRADTTNGVKTEVIYWDKQKAYNMSKPFPDT